MVKKLVRVTALSNNSLLSARRCKMGISALSKLKISVLLE